MKTKISDMELIDLIIDTCNNYKIGLFEIEETKKTIYYLLHDMDMNK